VVMTAIGISRRGLGVSSARLAAVSNPMNSSTPYSTPKKMPNQPFLLLRQGTSQGRLSTVLALPAKIAAVSASGRPSASMSAIASRTTVGPPSGMSVPNST
jgi:hypothetical protein